MLLFLLCINGYTHAQKLLIDSPGIFKGKPDILPTHQGGLDEWIKFIHQNFINSDSVPEGPIIVAVSLIIDKQGNISDFEPVHDPGYGILEKVINLIRTGRGYLPAKVNGKPVKYRYTETITIDISSD